MNKNDERPPEDPSAIMLTYEHQRHWWFSADDAPETWHVSADIGDGGPHVGDLDITLVDIYETQDPFALLDGPDAELGHVAAAIFDAGDGRLDPDLDEQLEPVGSLDPHPARGHPGTGVAGLRPRCAAGRDGDQEAVRRSPGSGVPPRPAQRSD